MTDLPTWAVILHGGRIIAIGATDETHARAIYGYDNDVRHVEPYDPLKHLFDTDLAEWKAGRVADLFEPFTATEPAAPVKPKRTPEEKAERKARKAARKRLAERPWTMPPREDAEGTDVG